MRFAAMLTALALFAPASMEAQTMVISRGGSRDVRTPPPDNFTGSVRVEMLFEAVDPSHASGGYVTFEPRAARRGIRIREGRSSSSLPESVASSYGARPSKRFARGTW